MEAQTRFRFRLRKSFKKAKSNVGRNSIFPLGLFKGDAPRKIWRRLTAQIEISRTCRETERQTKDSEKKRGKKCLDLNQFFFLTDEVVPFSI